VFCVVSKTIEKSRRKSDLSPFMQTCGNREDMMRAQMM